MYNVEKYVGACLDSILGQTFQNYEVIVVDDCSTDTSYSIVESYIPKFNGRLNLLKMNVNSGPGAPSNKAVAFSRGKYIFAMDSDDLITVNALGELYQYAENFGVDVVYMDRHFDFPSTEPVPLSDKDVKLVPNQIGLVERPTFESDDVGERLNKFARGSTGVTGWQKFVKRDLLIENNITFPNMRNSQDIIWSMEVFFSAKRILTIPQPFYIFRINPTSNTNTKRSLSDTIHFFFDSCNEGIKLFDDWLSEQKFFKENPHYHLLALNFFEGIHFRLTLKHIINLPSHEVFEILKPKFVEMFGEYGALIAYIYNLSISSRISLVANNQRIFELEKKLRELQAIKGE